MFEPLELKFLFETVKEIDLVDCGFQNICVSLSLLAFYFKLGDGLKRHAVKMIVDYHQSIEMNPFS